MKKLVIFLFGMVACTILHASPSTPQTQYIWNPFTGTLQYLTSIDTTSIKGGTSITVVSTSSGVTISEIPTYVLITSTYTVLSTDSIVDCSTTSAFSVCLPTAVGIPGTSYTIYDSSGIITVTPNGAETINGFSNYVMRNQFESINIFSDNVNWKIR